MFWADLINLTENFWLNKKEHTLIFYSLSSKYGAFCVFCQKAGKSRENNDNEDCKDSNRFTQLFANKGILFLQSFRI